MPEMGGVVIDMSRMASVIHLHAEDLMVTVQAGIKKSALAEWLKPKGFMFMVDPGSDATIGGYASTGARYFLRLFNQSMQVESLTPCCSFQRYAIAEVRHHS